ncbi:MAG: hypothetical protein KTR31_12425 [Myxococcales bacterium]|nr:hypothetical protein [Myxococcales bacterium]
MLVASVAAFAALALIWLSLSAPLADLVEPHGPPPAVEQCLQDPISCADWASPSMAALPAPGQLSAWRVACAEQWNAASPMEARLRVPVGCRSGLPAGPGVVLQDWELEALESQEADPGWVQMIIEERDWALVPHVPRAPAEPLELTTAALTVVRQHAASSEAKLARAREVLWTAALTRPEDPERTTGVMTALQEKLGDVWAPLAWWAGLLAAGVAGLAGIVWARASQGVRIGVTAHQVTVGRSRVALHDLRTSQITTERVVLRRADGSVVRSPPLLLPQHSVEALQEALATAQRMAHGGAPEDPDARRSVEALSKRTR